jgi:hypothetical protein
VHPNGQTVRFMDDRAGSRLSVPAHMEAPRSYHRACVRLMAAIGEGSP